MSGRLGAAQAAAQAAAAAMLSRRGSTISSRSAAAVLDLPLLTVPDRPCVTVHQARRISASSVHVHHAQLSHTDCRSVGWLSCTSASRTIVDVARECGVEEAVVVADAALRRGLADLASISEAADRCAGWPGIARAYATVASAVAAAESPLESVSRLRLAERGLDRPLLQENVFDLDGHWLARTDFYWPDAGVVGEADGMTEYSDWAVLRDDKRRQERLEQAGLIVVRWGWTDLEPIWPLIVRLQSAFERGRSRAEDQRRWQTSSQLLAAGVVL